MASSAKKKMTKDSLSVEEATQLVREQAFERLDTKMISFCITQVIKHIRLKTLSKEEIVQRLLGQHGLSKVYSLFNQSRASDVRKLAGRLICEALYKSSDNQDFFCGLFDIDCTYGHVSINQSMPVLIKQKLAEDPDFLFSLHSIGKLSENDSMLQSHEVDSSYNNNSKRYWSFPEFKEISSAVLSSQRQMTETYHTSEPSPIRGNRSSRASSDIAGQPSSRAKQLRIQNETVLEYVNFPDPQLYMIGFKVSRSQETKLEQFPNDDDRNEQTVLNTDLKLSEHQKPTNYEMMTLNNLHQTTSSQLQPHQLRTSQGSQQQQQQRASSSRTTSQEKNFLASSGHMSTELGKIGGVGLGGGATTREDYSQYSNQSYIVTSDGVSVQQQQLPSNVMKQPMASTVAPYISSGGGTRQPQRGQTRDSQQSRQTSSSAGSYQRYKNGLGQQPSQSGVNAMRVQQIGKPSSKTRMARGFSGTTGGFPANEYNIKPTTDSSESENSQARYMRATSSSIERAKINRQFGKSPTQVSTNVPLMTTSGQTWAQLRNYKNNNLTPGSQERQHKAALYGGSVGLPHSCRVPNPQPGGVISNSIPPPPVQQTVSSNDKNKTMQIKSLQKLAQNFMNSSQMSSTMQRGPTAAQSQSTNKKPNSTFSSVTKNRTSLGAGPSTQEAASLMQTSPFDLQGQNSPSPRRAKTARDYTHQSTTEQSTESPHGQVSSQRAAQVMKISQQLNSGAADFQNGGGHTDMKGIIKKLNKPEMLLLNHLQNQIKYYYPQKMNKYLNMEQSQLTAEAKAAKKQLQQSSKATSSSAAQDSSYKSGRPSLPQQQRLAVSPFLAAGKTSSSEAQGNKGLFQTIEKQRIQLNKSQLAGGGGGVSSNGRGDTFHHDSNHQHNHHQRVSYQQWASNQTKSSNKQQTMTTSSTVAAQPQYGGNQRKKNYLTKSAVLQGGSGQHQNNTAAHGTSSSRAQKKQVSSSQKRQLQSQQHPSTSITNITHTSSDIGRSMNLQNSKNSFSSKKGSGTQESDLNLTNLGATKTTSGAQTQRRHQARYLNSTQVMTTEDSIKRSKKLNDTSVQGVGNKTQRQSSTTKTTSTSVTRRQQELSNARLYAGARAPIVLKSSLIAQARPSQNQKGTNSNNGSKEQRNLKQANSVLYSNSMMKREGQFQTRQPSKSHGTKIKRELNQETANLGACPFQNQATKMRNNLGSATERARVRGGGDKIAESATSEKQLMTMSSHYSASGVSVTYTESSQQTQPSTKQIAGGTAPPQSAYIQVLERMKGRIVSQVNSQQNNTGSSMAIAPRGSRSPNVKASYLQGNQSQTSNSALLLGPLATADGSYGNSVAMTQPATQHHHSTLDQQMITPQKRMESGGDDQFLT